MRLVSSANQRSTRFSQDELVGVKYRWKRAWRSSDASPPGLMRGVVAQDQVQVQVLQVQADHVADLLDELRVGAQLRRLDQVGLSSNARQIREMADWLMPWPSSSTGSTIKAYASAACASPSTSVHRHRDQVKLGAMNPRSSLARHLPGQATETEK